MNARQGILAHGIGGRSDLPLDAGAAAVGAGLAVAVSFAALAVLRPRPWLDPARVRPLGRVRLPLGPLRALVLAAAVGVVGTALLGPADPARNLAPWVLHVWVWVGVAFASALLGPVWRAVNPLRTLHRLLPARPPRPLPAGVGLWPAAAALAVYTWLELVAPFGAAPRAVGVYLLVQSALLLVGAARYGEDFLARADPFEVYSTLLGALSPLHRDGGRLVLRNPLSGLLTVPARPGLVAVAVVLLGSTAFDGLSRSVWWATLPPSVALDTAGLAAGIALIAALYLGACRLVARLAPVPVGAPGPRPGTARVAARFAPTLLPIALGYAVAHYGSFLLLEGQTVLVLLGLLPAVQYGWLTPAAVVTVQLNAVVLGHVAATAAAHDLALRTAVDARREQVPLVVAMVLLTGLAIVLLLSG